MIPVRHYLGTNDPPMSATDFVLLRAWVRAQIQTADIATPDPELWRDIAVDIDDAVMVLHHLTARSREPYPLRTIRVPIVSPFPFHREAVS